jgi:hypothetical protein
MMDIEISFVRVNKKGAKSTVSARSAARILHRDVVDLDNARDRRKFVVAVLSTLWPEKPQDDWPAEAVPILDAKLIELAEVPAAPPTETAAEAGEPAELLAATPDDIKAEAERILTAPDLFGQVCSAIQKVGVTGEWLLSASLYLIGTSRLLSDPVSGIVQGASASGKSYVIEKVATLFPPEGVVCATQMTPQALFHMKPDGLVHKWLVAGERSRIQDDDRAEATRALRELQSQKRLSKLMPVKGPGGVIKTELIVLEGPIAFVESTTLHEVFEEDANRCLLLATDETPEQTRRVIEAIARDAAGKGDPHVKRLVAVYQTVQRLLGRCDVVIPFAERLGERFPGGRVDYRRNFGHLVSLIQASALLHQKQRARDVNGNVVATATDYQIAAELAAAPMGRAAGGLSRGVLDFYRRLVAKLGSKKDFTTKDAKQGEAGYGRSVYNWLSALDEAGVIDQTEPAKGRVSAKWSLTDKAPDEATVKVVPDVDDVFPSDGDGCTHAHKP